MALVLLSIALTMTFVIVNVIDSDAAATLAAGSSTELTARSIATVDSYVRGVVTPASATLASNFYDPTVTTPTTPLPCWGANLPNATGAETPKRTRRTSRTSHRRDSERGDGDHLRARFRPRIL